MGCINVRFASTGNIITKIKPTKNKVNIFFDNEQKIEITQEAFVSAYLYVGKELSLKEINKILSLSNMEKALKYALSIVKKNIITEWNLRQKLYAKDFEKSDVDGVIKFLKNNDLLNDKAYIEDYIEYSKDMLYGKNKIIVELKKRGIFEESLKGVRFPKTIEEEKAKKLLKKLEYKYTSYNNEQKKQHIYDAFIRYGYDNDIALSMLSLIKSTKKEDELRMLRVDLGKKIHIAQRKCETRKEVKEYLIKTLRSKGYKYNDIIKVMEESDL